MFNLDDRWFLYGTSSFVTVHPSNFSCANSDTSFFAMIPNYIEWIKNFIDDKNTFVIPAMTRTINKVNTTPRQSLSCGIPGFDSSGKRILNGENAVPFAWPWMISLRTKNLRHVCSGVLIGRQHLLTAAHCFPDTPAKNILAVLGINNLRQPLNQRNRHDVSRIFLHPEFNNRTGINDIAVLKLSRPVVFTKRVGPICLPRSDDYSIIYNQSAIITGW